MNVLEQQAYNNELKRVARRLSLPQTGNIEEAIIRYCHNQVAAWIKEHGQPITLSELSNLFATSLSMGFEEIYNKTDLEDLLKRIPPKLAVLPRTDFANRPWFFVRDSLYYGGQRWNY